MSRETMFLDEDQALNEVLPFLDKWAEDLGVDDYVQAPIVSAERWSAFFGNLEVCPSHIEPPNRFYRVVGDKSSNKQTKTRL